MTKANHEAVMVDEVLENLVFKQNGKYVDCTFGAGGHSSEILKKLDKKGSLISIDKDNRAVINLSSEFKDDPRFRLINDTFSNLQNLFKDEEIDENAADIKLKADVQPESTESEAELRKEEVLEDSKEIIENKNKDDHQKEEVAEQIEANADFETNSVNEVVVDTKNSDTKEKPELEVEVESDAS